MGSHGNALAVSFFRRRARLRSRAHYFHCSTEKRCGQLGRYVSLNEIHVLYCDMIRINKLLNYQIINVKNYSVVALSMDDQCLELARYKSLLKSFELAICVYFLIKVELHID